jgi:hypothetical protein
MELKKLPPLKIKERPGVEEAICWNSSVHFSFEPSNTRSHFIFIFLLLNGYITLSRHLGFEQSRKQKYCYKHEILSGSLTGKQQGGLQSFFSAIGGSVGGLENKAAASGMDPALIQGVIAMLSGGAGAEAGSGFNLESLIQGKNSFYGEI